MYADCLVFLMNSMEKRKTTGNIKETSHEKEEIVLDEEQIGGEKKETEEDQQSDDGNPMMQQGTSNKRGRVPQTEQRKATKTKLTPFQSELLKKLDEDKAGEKIDADKMFLLSLLPDFKKLNNEQKLDFKFMTLQFFRNQQN